MLLVFGFPCSIFYYTYSWLFPFSCGPRWWQQFWTYIIFFQRFWSDPVANPNQPLWHWECDALTGSNLLTYSKPELVCILQLKNSDWNWERGGSSEIWVSVIRSGVKGILGSRSNRCQSHRPQRENWPSLSFNTVNTSFIIKAVNMLKNKMFFCKEMASRAFLSFDI